MMDRQYFSAQAFRPLPMSRRSPGSILLAMPTASDIRRRLIILEEERDAALEWGTGDPGYIADLDDDIATTTAIWIGVAVTELAVFRGQLSGRPQG